ncbi:MAG: HD domain-containing protein [Alphaproteobacteria bacterium]|nr:HD domain-containing protein [Alphaproteobacteria bacterium]
MAAFARHLMMEPDSIRLLGLAGLLHDIGKTELSIAVLDKPGRLTANEMAHMRSHPARGHRFLSQFGSVPDVVLDICLHHHERLDGTGYPDRLAGAEISLPVRIATICDVYDALVSPRQYRPAWTPKDTADWMLQADGFFDPDLLRQFLHLVSTK